MEKTVIEVKNLHKSFKLPTEKVNSVKSVFTNFGSFRKKTYETQKALRGVSFEVKEGEFFGIVGRNGSGKSTLLKLLAGIYQPTKGSITTKGKVVPFIELGVGFNPELSGKDNVFLNGAMLGFTDKEVDAKYNDIVDFAELHEHMEQKLKSYSSGMQVRLAFSVATILAESDILLLDEVLAVGDADFQRKCFDYFKNLKKNKKTVVFVSHDMSAIREYCDRAVLIDDSKLVFKGSAEKVANEYIKLFSENSSKQSSSENRWGDGKVSYMDLEVSVENSNVYLNVSAKAYAELDSGNFGFIIRNAEGVSVVGTNSQIKNIKIGPLKKGQIIKLGWTIPNIFSTGTYSISPAIVSENHIDIHDWWEDAKRFKIINNENTPHVVSPSIGLKEVR